MPMKPAVKKSFFAKSFITWAVLGIVIIIIALFIWWSQKPAPKQYLTHTVASQDIQETVLAGGQVYAKSLVDVGAQATGQVQKLYVTLGQRVQKGDPIATIDSTTQKNALADDEANYQILLAQHANKKLQLSQSKDEFSRLEKAYIGGVLAQNELDKAKNTLMLLQNDIKASDMQLAQAKLKINTAKTNLSYANIKAPMDGVVVSVVTQAGQTINAMQSSPTIVRLADIDTVQIKAKFSESDIGKLKVGMPATISFTGVMGDFSATLDALELAPTSDNGAVYYYGLLNLPNPEHKLYIGMNAQVSIAIAQKSGVVSVPATALEAVGGDKYQVQVMQDGVPVARSVTVGLNNGVDAEIVQGLRVGEEVVLSESDGTVDELAMN